MFEFLRASNHIQFREYNLDRKSAVIFYRTSSVEYEFVGNTVNHDMPSVSIENITCEDFAKMPESEQRAFVIGVANGRGMTSGMFRAYAGAAQDFATTDDERAAIARSYDTIHSMILPLLEIDAASLLNGIRVACKRPEFRNEFVISALASVHVDAAKALKEYSEREGG